MNLPGARAWESFLRSLRVAVSTLKRAAPREYAAMLTASVVSGVALLVLMLVGRELLTRLDADGGPGGLRELLPLVAVLGLATAAGAVASIVQAERRWLIGYLVEQETAGGIVDAAATVPLAEFESPEFHDHLQRSLREAIHRPWELTDAVGQLAGGLIGAAAASVVLLSVEPLLIPALVAAGIPAAWATTRNSKALFEAIAALTPLNRERQYLQAVLTGRQEAKEVRVFAARDHLRAQYDDRYGREVQALRRVSRLRTQRATLAGVVSSVIVVAALAGLLALTVRGDVALADAAIGAVAVQQIATRIRGVNSAVGTIQEASLFLDDYADFLARAQRAAPAAAQPAPTAAMVSGPVELTDVWFTYPGADQPALRGVDLRIEPGTVVALVGANGSGKTTLAKLICHLYSPDRGVIAWDGIPYGEPGTSGPRVSAIFQDFTRYELPAHDNIALGDAARFDDDDRVREVARAAGAAEFLEELPAAYRTWLSPSHDDGTDLSVGQWQRVALARALFRDASLLVLDEPTASLDPAAERSLIEHTSRLFADRAVLVISHRFANVVDADHIYVLDEGRILEHGSHDDLLTAEGRYAELFRLQGTPFATGSP